MNAGPGRPGHRPRSVAFVLGDVNFLALAPFVLGVGALVFGFWPRVALWGDVRAESA